MTDFLRQLTKEIPVRVLVAQQLVRLCQGSANLSEDHNGRGNAYSRLWYRDVDGKWRGMYLGRLNTNEKRILKTESRRKLQLEIRLALDGCRRLRGMIQTVAGGNGFRLAGNQVIRKRK